MHWYLVHTKPRQETSALNNLEQQGYVCYLPSFLSEKFHQGALTISHAPLFPRYLFIQLEQGNGAKSWSPIRSTRGVSRLVTFGNTPAKISDELINILKSKENNIQRHPEYLFSPGEKVKISCGSFAGIEGIYQIADGEHRVIVLIEILSKQVPMQVMQAHLRKVVG